MLVWGEKRGERGGDEKKVEEEDRKEGRKEGNNMFMIYAEEQRELRLSLSPHSLTV